MVPSAMQYLAESGTLIVVHCPVNAYCYNAVAKDVQQRTQGRLKAAGQCLVSLGRQEPSCRYTL